MPTRREIDTDHFYELLAQLEIRNGMKATLGDYSAKQPWPARGVYFFMEQDAPGG